MINFYDRKANKEVSSDFTNSSIQPVMPVLSTFPFLGINSSVNIYSLFIF